LLHQKIEKRRCEKNCKSRDTIGAIYAALQSSVIHDHDYTCNADPFPNQEENYKELNVQQRLIHDLYAYHLHVNATRISGLEASTRGQHESEEWYSERKLRITASIMKEVCHHRPTTSCESFVKQKLSRKPINTPAICYGRKHENAAISSYVKHQNMNGKVVNVESWGLFVDSSKPWLAATPDAIVCDFSELMHKRGCYVCETRTIEDSCKILLEKHRTNSAVKVRTITKLKHKCMLLIFSGATLLFGLLWKKCLLFRESSTTQILWVTFF